LVTLLSFVIPCFNEEESLRLLYEGIVRHTPCPYEILFINDGSTDASADIIKQLRQADENVHLISFRKNMGKSAALQAGFQTVKGSVVITMDADLQDEPTEIPRFLEKIQEGYDVVSGWKVRRLDPWEKRLPSKLFNRVVSALSGVKLHDFNCGFKAYRAEVVRQVNLYGELHRFIPVLAYRNGFSIAEIGVKHNERKFGKSKFGLERYLRGLFDAMTVSFLSKYHLKPMHFFGRFGFYSTLAGALLLVYQTIAWLCGQAIAGGFWLSLGLLVLGIQLFCAGLMSDMIVEKTFHKRYFESYVKEQM